MLKAVKRYYKCWDEVVIDELTQEDEDLLEEALRETKDALILDVGCGYGRIMKIIKKWGYYVIGIDVSEELLKRARGISDVIVGSLTHLPFRDKVFDVCLCIYGPLNHIPSLTNGIMEIARVCRWRIVSSFYNTFSTYFLYKPQKVFAALFLRHRVRILKTYHAKQLIKKFNECGLKVRLWRGQLLGRFKLHTHAKLIAIIADIQ